MWKENGNKGLFGLNFRSLLLTLVPHLSGVSLTYDMFPSAGLGLLALLRGIRSTGHTLKSFVLRFLLFFPHVLRSLRRIWSLRSGTSPKDVPKKKGGQARPSFLVASGVCEGYNAIYASRDFNRAGEPHLPLGPSNAEVLHLSPMTGQSQSTPQSPASSLAPSLPGSPQRSDRRLSAGSAHSIASSHNADSIHSTRKLTIRHLNTPLTLTHSRVTSTQFAGAPPSRSRSPSPFPFPSRSPSPSPSQYPHPLPQSSAQESSGTQIPDVVQIPQDTPEGSRRSSIDINISPPSRSQSPTTESERPTQDPSDPRVSGPPYLARSHANAHHSSGSLPASALTPSSDQARYRPSFPRSFTSQVSVVYIPVADASGILSGGRTRDIRLMHSEQVSRYVNKGVV